MGDLRKAFEINEGNFVEEESGSLGMRSVNVVPSPIDG